MKDKELDTKSAGAYAYAAAISADRYSDECRVLYTPRQRAAAETFADVVKLAYSASRSYITYRKTFITVKLENAQVRDRKTLREVEAIAQERGYERTRSNQGVSFRIPRVA